ncbi:DUF3040 domain-containing protein [Spirillospora albida]|uniref:DUF3040 domain-containing protein n=1 Tax=Spirillospora albida TaxID=58123 RepID=UPI0004C0EE68|nr:DUF3040 domain-containing protein [Spirillospora albida]
MALSMEERRILAEIEVRLSEDAPRLAHRLARHGARRRRLSVGRPPSRRVRLVAAAVVAVLAAVTAVAAAVVAAVT